MLSGLEKTDAIFQPTQFWLSGVQKILDDIHQHGLQNFRSHKHALMYFVPLYAFPACYPLDSILLKADTFLEQNNIFCKKHRLLLHSFIKGEVQAFSDYRVFLATLSNTHPFCNHASESEVGEPAEQFVFDGKRYSRSFLNYLLGLNFLKQHCDLTGINTVLEIGGGFGSLGEILLSDKRNHCFYIDIDIPPISYIATYYLQEVFGTHAIGAYDELRKQKQLSISAMQHQYQGIVLCPWQLPKLRGTIDLFVNFISFQEMEPRTVKNYLHHVDRLQAKYILLRNLREGKQKATDHNGGVGVLEPITADDYDDFLHNYQLVATNTVPFGYKTADGFHSELRIYRRKV